MIVFSAHAAAMLEERSIETSWVERVLARPDADEPDPVHPSRRRAFGLVPERDGRILRVVYTKSAEEVRVITAFLDRGRRASR